METAGIVCRTVSRLPEARDNFCCRFSWRLNLGVGGSRVSVRPRIKSCRRSSFQFSDIGHVQYYASLRSGCDGDDVATKKDKGKSSEIRRVKKKLKLMKRLSKDLSMLPQFAAAEDIRIGLATEVKVTTIEEASNVLLAQLQKLILEQKELKRKLKEERAQLKATLGKSKSSSSSSSSESSDSDCGEVVDMKSLRSNALKPSLETQAPTGNALKQPLETEIEAAPMVAEESPLAHSLSELENSDSSPTIRVRVPLIDGEFCSSNGFNDHSSSWISTKKIEVCLGGKCKKLGAASLLEEFKKKVGSEATIVACKCMGKCSTAPNVRVSNTQSKSASRINEDSVRFGNNPTCTGVGLQDVDLIVSNLLCKDRDDECLMLSS